MHVNNKLWLVAPLALGLIVAACGDDDSADDAATEAPAETAATEAAAEEPTAEPAEDVADEASGSGIAVAMLGDEEITIASALCFFEEQERAGLGGVWTHTSQATGTNEAGEPVVVGLDRARNEDGTVKDSVYVNIGEPAADDFVGLTAEGPEGLIVFGDSSVSAEDVEVGEFGSDPVPLTISFDC